MNPSELYPQPEGTVTILIVNPSDHECGLLRQILRDTHWAVSHVRTCSEALAYLNSHSSPVVIAERDLPDGDWRLLLLEAAKLPTAPSFIVSSRLADEALWAEVLNLGAYDLLQTPFEAGELLRVLFLAWAAWKREWDRANAPPPKKPSATPDSPATRTGTAGGARAATGFQPPQSRD